MFSIRQSSRVRGSAGEPLPTVFKGLKAQGTELLRGQLSLVSGPPGTFKSVLAATFALETKVPSLIISADSDPFIQQTRAVSICTGMTLEASAKIVLENRLHLVPGLDRPVRYTYEANPTIDDIESTVEGYWELFGDYPEYIAVDNISDVALEATEESQSESLDGLLKYLHGMARNTGAHVMGLHHVTGQYNDGNKPIPMSGIKGQLGKIPELILTIHRAPTMEGQPGILRISTVKQRGGKADPSGELYTELEVEPEKALIHDPSFTETLWGSHANGQAAV